MELETRSRAIMVVDIEKSSDRTDPQKAELREALYRVLRGALETAPPHWLGDLGDGAFVVFDSEVLPVLHPVVDEVVDLLRRHNASVDPSAWMRLRLGIHFGLVARDANGWVGDDLTTTFRIVNGAGVKAVLHAAQRAQSIVVVSDAVHHSVVRHGYPQVRPETYRELLDDGRKVWIRTPGYATPPAPVTAERARAEAPAAKSVSIKAKGNAFTVDTITTVDARTSFGGGS